MILRDLGYPEDIQHRFFDVLSEENETYVCYEHRRRFSLSRKGGTVV